MTSNDIVAQYNPDNPPSTNIERWMNYLQYVEAPNSYIVFGFYSAIQAALQRRVYKWHGDVKCFPNDFTIMVGPASVGKGRVIKPYKMLFDGFYYNKEQWAYDEYGKEIVGGSYKAVKEEVDIDQKEQLLREARAMLDGNKYASLMDDLLFPCPADSSSLRALSTYMANSTRIIRYLEPNLAGEMQKKSYLHSSIMILLEELVSLFKDRRETKDIVDFLVQTWDAGSYRHATVGYGIDNIENCCVNLLAGTTPDSMEELFTQRLLREGLSSRTIFIYEGEKRFRRYPRGSGLSNSQQKSMYELRLHVKKLAHVFGSVKFSPEAENLMGDWYENHQEDDRANKHGKLDGYYGRQIAHIIKLAMGIHFSESLTRFVSAAEVHLAMDLLASVELNMHKALRIAGRNDAFQVQKKILGYIRQFGPVNIASILLEFMEDVKGIDDLEELLATLTRVGSITKDTNNRYSAKKQERMVV